MRARPLPRTYVAFTLLTLLGPPLIVLIQGDALHAKVVGLMVVVLLLLGLAYGSTIVWGLFVLWNLFLVFSVAAVSGGTWDLPSGALLLLLALGSLALLMSPSMRRHVGVRRPHVRWHRFG